MLAGLLLPLDVPEALHILVDADQVLVPGRADEVLRDGDAMAMAIVAEPVWRLASADRDRAQAPPLLIRTPEVVKCS
jgi:hypothetical protein